MLDVLEEFDDVITKKLGFECLEGLAADMTNPDPLKRLTIDEGSSRYREIQQELSSWKLRQRVRKGVPARESRTEIRLVSPAAGCQKKKEDTSS